MAGVAGARQHAGHAARPWGRIAASAAGALGWGAAPAAGLPGAFAGRALMPQHSETRHLPYSPQQMFDLVADVPRYPDFLPWVAGARVRAASEHELVADLIVGFKMIREGFTSRVRLDRPRYIIVDYVSGPLRYLHNVWSFEPDNRGGCILSFEVDFEFRNRLFEKLAGAVFGEAVQRMVGAFETRAAQLYGSSSSSAQRTA